ncbi:uncharacterized protein EV422DRAFT_570773 [Fimicolochytrium jonesii]|uniref:uncharacterized protein n=1 Tax=Fimicolochytrium jonesii TaxID=1396493 RepID=UPI0022FE35B5|nr:uncharacterized protein EV422DRAFT_570773 [Fimicolochytrium jonesii]KAI8817426.1 hypothetical protein EV422DRAFT_570773 [Fimicolochytrium jonesii]
MRKIPANETGRSSPTLTPTTPTGATQGILWGSSSTLKSGSQPSSGNANTWSSGSQSVGGAATSGGGASGNAHGGGTGGSMFGSQDLAHLKYSREFILSIFDPSLPVPPDFTPADPMTSDHPLEPMANIPLNDNEKKLFTSQSINSEISARRPPYSRGDSKDGTIRPPRPPGSVQRSYSNRGDNRGDRGGHQYQQDGTRLPRRADTYGGEEDPWDAPTGVGSFSGNGAFSKEGDGTSTKNGVGENGRGSAVLAAERGRKSPSRSVSPNHSDKRGPSPTKPAQGPLAAASTPVGAPATNDRTPASSIGGAGSSSKAPDNKENKEAFSSNVNASFVEMFNSFGSTPLGSPIGMPTTSGLSKLDTLPSMSLGKPMPAPGNPLGLNRSDMGQVPSAHSAAPPGMVAPPTPFVPQKWQYKDPSGTVQGPFSSQQMQDWYRSNYFNEDLPIKHVDDLTYQPLGLLLLKFGHDQPFVAEEADAQQRHQQAEQQRRLPTFGTHHRDMYADMSGTGGAGFGSGASYNSGGLADPFGRDRYPTGGYDPMNAHHLARPSWTENPNHAALGWAGLNTDLHSPFGRSSVGAPRSPATSLQSSYFDPSGQDRAPLAGSIGPNQRSAAAAFTPFGAPLQQQVSQPAPQSPAANLFSGQALLDFSGSAGSQTPKPASQQSQHQDWGKLHGYGGGDDDHHHADDDHHPAPVDVVSHLIDDAHFDEQHHEEERAAVEPTQQITKKLEGLTVKDSAHAKPAKPVQETSTKVEGAEKAKKTRKEERQERFAKEQAANKQAPQNQAQQGSDTSAAAANSAVGLRQIMSEQQTTSKRDKEHAAVEKAKELQREAELIEQQLLEQQKAAASALSSAWTTSTAAPAEKPKLSLKEIQEIEQQRREAEEREKQRRAHEAMMQQAAYLQEQDALSASQAWAKEQAQGAAVWSGKKPAQPARQKSLAEIMDEEEKRKRKEAAARGANLAETVAAPTGAGKRYADTIVTAGGGASTISWGLAGAAAVPVRPSTGSRAAAVVASGEVIKGTPLGAKAGEGAPGAWNVVGKQGHVVKPPAPTPRPAAPAVRAPVVSVPRSVVVNSALASTATAPPSQAAAAKTPSPAFMQWCRSALRPLERNSSAGVNVGDFINILLSISPTEPAITQSICDDILGGLTAIDPRKFADEFVRKRKADASGEPTSPGAVEAGWTAVGSVGAAVPVGVGAVGLDTFESGGNRFVVVGKGSKKKKGKK